MKQKKVASKLSGAQGFEFYYRELYGARWDSLKAALASESDSVTFQAGGSEPYYLDSGSVRCAVSLPLKGARSILDLCAAPGGKSLVIASCMDKDATLLSNERSTDRRERLSRVLDSCLPESVRSRVTVCGNDGAVMCLRQSECFDRILLDAPCSSERHVLADEKYLGEWSPSRIKTLSMAQWALMSSAWRMLEKGGYLLYSTCALAKDENDGIIARLLKKFDDVCVEDPSVSSDVSAFCNVSLPDTEKTEYGRIVLPDVHGGAGPLYFSLLKKY